VKMIDETSSEWKCHFS